MEPIKYTCQECGEIYEEGYVNADNYPVQAGWLCPKCKLELPQTTVTTIMYHGKKQKWFIQNLDCLVCKQAPCKHMKQNPCGCKDQFWAYWVIDKEEKQS